MPGHMITCPYCFKQFDDSKVHFRMETVDPDEEAFAPRTDEKYEEFWEPFGGTTELFSPSRDRAGDVSPWLRPVYDPMDPSKKEVFGGSARYLVGDDIVIGVKDRHDAVTERRVCPACHNPLPGRYGRYPVKFISLIGISGAGKTVYLSQLCKFMAARMGAYNIAVMPTSAYAYEYMTTNRVAANALLPQPTPPEIFQQPLCFDFHFRDSTGQPHSQTFVFYDIAGENLQFAEGRADIAESARRFGPFIRHSDAIIMLIDPMQFSGDDDHEDAVTALTVIDSMFDRERLRHLPLAVCISQADGKPQLPDGTIDKYAPTFCSDIIHVPALPEMRVNEGMGERFSVTDYNELRDRIDAFVRSMAYDVPLHTTLSMTYGCYNYFMIESIGVDLVEQEGEGGFSFMVPSATPRPKRIIEPILWILSKLPIGRGDMRPILEVRGFINEPGDWTCPFCGRPHIRATEDFCPNCRLNRFGQWRCPSCGVLNSGASEWCVTKGCKTDRFGNRKKMFGVF